MNRLLAPALAASLALASPQAAQAKQVAGDLEMPHLQEIPMIPAPQVNPAMPNQQDIPIGFMCQPKMSWIRDVLRVHQTTYAIVAYQLHLLERIRDGESDVVLSDAVLIQIETRQQQLSHLNDMSVTIQQALEKWISVCSISTLELIKHLNRAE